MQIRLCVIIQNSEAFMLADLPCLLPFKAAVRQLHSKTQLGSKLLVDVLFRIMEYALTSVVNDGLVGMFLK